MLTKSHRFHGRKDINQVHRQGKNASGSLFAIKALPNNKTDKYRVAIVVSKKVSKSAVERNRIRRRIYSAIRTQSELTIEPYDIVVIAFKKDILTEPQASLVKQLTSQLVSCGAARVNHPGHMV